MNLFQKNGRPPGISLILITGLLLTGLCAFLVIFHPAGIHFLNQKVYDGFSRAEGGLKPSGRVVVVAIDDRSLKEFGQWPWPRYRIAQLLDRIKIGQPSAVGLDILFPETDRTSPCHLQEAMARDFNVHIRFEGLPENLLDNDRILASALLSGHYAVGSSLLFDRDSAQTSADCGQVHPVIQTRPGFPSFRDCLPAADAVECAIPGIEKAAAASGFINAVSDADGVVRGIPMLARCHSDVFPSLSLATLMIAESSDEGHPVTPIVCMREDGMKSLQVGRYSIPVDAAGRMLIHYYPHRDFNTYVSAADILNNRLALNQLYHRVVFVGLIASGLKDAVATPMSPFCPGVVIHANAVDSILQSSYISQPSWTNGLHLITVVAAGILVTVWLSLTGSVAGLAACGVLAAGAWIGAYELLCRTGIFISPLMVSGLLLGLLTIFSLIRLQQSRGWAAFFRLALARAVVSIQSMKAAKEFSELASRLKSDFLARMSHDIRTPMNAILGMAELLSETPLTDEQKECLRTLKNSGELLLALINDILDLSKIEAGQMMLESVSMDIRKLMEGTLALLSQRARQQGVELVCNIAVDVPQYLKGDPTRIQQIVMNLLGNAVKFTPRGFIRVEMTSLASEGDPDRYQIVVQDTGIGIAPEKQSEIFESFVQADASITRQYGGTGLGLAITKRLIEKMGGAIHVESTPGQGSRFIFTLMLPRAEKPPETVSVREVAKSMSTLPVLRLLLVDDVPVNRKLIEAYLKNTPIHIETAENGQQALDLWTETSFDIVLMDMEMPVMNGFDATRRIREIEKKQGGTHIPIVALTAHAFSEERRRCMDAGCTHFFTKPVRKADLLQLLLDIFSATTEKGLQKPLS